MRKVIIGVMGPGGGATAKDISAAEELGRLVAAQGWVLLSGGRKEGVMDAVNRGAKEGGGLTVGIMPTSDHGSISGAVDIPIITDMKSARNNINVLSSDVVIACGIGAGTASEIALAIKAGKQVVMLNQSRESEAFFKTIGDSKVHLADGPEEAIELVKAILER